MTDLARNGSILVAEIKAVHPAGSANGSVLSANGAVPGSATDGGVAAPAVDPSVTTPQGSTLANGGHAAEASALSAGTGAVALGHPPHEASAGSVGAAPITAPATTGSEAAPSLMQPQTTPIQPIQPSDRALAPSTLDTTVPPAAAGSAPGSALEPGMVAPGTAPGSVISATSPVSPQQQQQPQQVAPVPVQQQAAVAPAAANGAAVAAAAPAPTTAAAQAPKSAMSPKEIKKMDKLMKTEAKNEHKSLKRAIKDASSSEKLMRKSRDAEAQAMKRHEKATTNEHKAAKALSKAKAEHEKYAAELAKAVEDLDIKKRHTATTHEGYENAKKKIDELRAQKALNDKERATRSAQMHGVRQ
ncbi:hypothetical protein BCV70DRAFT_80900 [Testicularia cyperi]|uniref:DNA binding protein Ncp1 n=1 Tax=Testicularia cyperi TaxID=1882483 RepID=A0A317XH05_9BASI|nr:hypothetical protein BCV70DRAFT_80900 [Testicularia cyperi]